MQEALHFRAWQLELAEIRKQQRAGGKVFYREFTDEEIKEGTGGRGAQGLKTAIYCTKNIYLKRAPSTLITYLSPLS